MNNFLYQKILIVRLSSLGDVLLTTPLLRSLKKEEPKLEIHYLVREEYKDVLINNPHIANLITIKRDEQSFVTKAALSQNKYELVIDLQNNLRSRNLTSDLRCLKVKFKKYNLRKFLLVKFKINLLKNLPAVPLRYASVIPNLTLDSDGLELITNHNASNAIKGLNNIIGFCPGSKHFTKMWLKEYYIELGKKLINRGFQIVLFGGREDLQICKEIFANVPGCVNLCNDNNILQTAADMKLCKTILCNDSGLMHTACAMKVPVVAIFGSTVKEFGFTPYGCKYLVLENKSLSCRPCSHIGRNNCPKVHFKCIKHINPQLVFNSLQSFLNQL